MFRQRWRASAPASAGLAVCLLSIASAFAVPPPAPGGHHALTFGGDNRAGYPAVSLTDAGDPSAESLPLGPAVTVHPNPFQRSTMIRFALRPGQRARCALYDLAGRRLREYEPAAAGSGWQEIAWDGRDRHGRTLPAGVYLYRLDTGVQVVTGKLVLLH